MTEYRFTTPDLAAEFDLAPKTVRKKARALGIGINRGGRAGFRYSEADRQRLIDSMRPEAPVTVRRRRKRSAAA